MKKLTAVAKWHRKTRTIRSFIRFPDGTAKDRERKNTLRAAFVKLHRTVWTPRNARRRLTELYEIVAGAFLDAYGRRFPPQHEFYETEVLVFVLSVVAKEQYIPGVTVWCPMDIFEQHCVAIPFNTAGGQPMSANILVISQLLDISKSWQLARIRQKETPTDARSAREPLQAPQTSVSTGRSAGESVQPPATDKESTVEPAYEPRSEMPVAGEPVGESMQQRRARLPRSITDTEGARKLEEFLQAKTWTLKEFSEKSGVGERTLSNVRHDGKGDKGTWKLIRQTIAQYSMDKPSS